MIYLTPFHEQNHYSKKAGPADDVVRNCIEKFQFVQINAVSYHEFSKGYEGSPPRGKVLLKSIALIILEVISLPFKCIGALFRQSSVFLRARLFTILRRSECIIGVAISFFPTLYGAFLIERALFHIEAYRLAVAPIPPMIEKGEPSNKIARYIKLVDHFKKKISNTNPLTYRFFLQDAFYLQRSSGWNEIQSAYRTKFAPVMHEDKCPDNDEAKEAFIFVTKARDKLKVYEEEGLVAFARASVDQVH